jgi:CheY-like chemotaxis protein
MTGIRETIHYGAGKADNTDAARLSSSENRVEGNRACRILVVDDNQDGADLMAVLLRLQGHTVEVANDGVTALTSAAAFDPDVVLLDIGLPGMNGYAVARQLREARNKRPQCLIAMTGYGTDEDRQRTVEAGFDHHIVKPIEPAELNALLARSLASMGL